MLTRKHATALCLVVGVLLVAPAVGTAETVWNAGTLTINTDAGTIFLGAVNQGAPFTTTTTVLPGPFHDVTTSTSPIVSASAAGRAVPPGRASLSGRSRSSG